MKKISLAPEFPNYEVWEDGSIYSFHLNRVLKTSLGASKYRRITLSNCGKKQTFLIHRLVAMAFLPNPENLPQVNHIDGDTLNNNVSNLEWSTSQNNILHSYKTGLNGNVGEKHHWSKLSIVDVKTIRKRYNAGEKQVDIAKDYPVSRQTITKIVNNQRWKHNTH